MFLAAWWNTISAPSSTSRTRSKSATDPRTTSETSVRPEDLRLTGGEVIENDDLGTVFEQAVHGVGADEPGAAGHDDAPALEGVAAVHLLRVRRRHHGQSLSNTDTSSVTTVSCSASVSCG